ncbi:MAG: hypothetical protein ACRYE7_02485 [Janthinobacterium lividum]
MQKYQDQTEDDLEWYKDRAETEAWVEIEKFMFQKLNIRQGETEGDERSSTGSRQGKCAKCTCKFCGREMTYVCYVRSKFIVDVC